MNSYALMCILCYVSSALLKLTIKNDDNNREKIIIMINGLMMIIDDIVMRCVTLLLNCPLLLLQLTSSSLKDAKIPLPQSTAK